MHGIIKTNRGMPGIRVLSLNTEAVGSSSSLSSNDTLRRHLTTTRTYIPITRRINSFPMSSRVSSSHHSGTKAYIIQPIRCAASLPLPKTAIYTFTHIQFLHSLTHHTYGLITTSLLATTHHEDFLIFSHHVTPNVISYVSSRSK